MIVRNTLFPLALAITSLAVGQLPAQPPTRDALVAHYTQVLRELRATDTSHLSAAQKRERARLIAALDRYRRAADFGINDRHPGERKPYFVDDGGRRCAVAFLLDDSGMGDLTLDVARTARHAWVAELAGNRDLLAWLERSGLTLEEAGRIQGPARRPSEPPARVFDDPSDWRREYRQERGQQDAGPTPGSRQGDNAAPTPGAPPTLRPGAPSTVRAGQTTPRGVPLSALPSQTWSTWWQWNRDEFIHPRARRASRPPADWTAADTRDARAERLFTELRKHAHDSSARVRQGVAVAMSRLGDDRSVPALVDMLDDPSLDVRHAAILALGGTGTSRAVLELLHIARHGAARGGTAEISSLAQPLATIALGLAKRYGNGVATATLVHGDAFRTAKPRTRDMQLARLLYQVLAPGKDAAALARSLAEGQDTPLDLRCRALEVLPLENTDPNALASLIRALNGSRLEARRSAALALGWFDHRLALGPLTTAFELEGELLTRAFLLLSIGRQGSKAGRDFLLAQLKSGRKSLRPWAAVGLGLGARQGADLGGKVVRDAILAARRIGRNHDDNGAYLIALGMMRDRRSVGLLTDELVRAKSSITRAAAAEALVLVGPDVARPVLRRLLQDDRCYFARSAYAGILGVIGDAADAPLLADALRKEEHPDARASIARALGMLEDAAGFDALLPVLADPDTRALTRAHVIEGLGASLSRNPGMEMAGLFQRSNFLVFPGWLQAIGTVRL